MAEEIYKIEKIIKELIKSLKSYSRVRHAKYEMELWAKYGFQLSEIDPWAIQYVSNGFIKKSIYEANDETIIKGLTRLENSQNSCQRKCIKTVLELNKVLNELGEQVVRKPKTFVDWLTFAFTIRKNEAGDYIKEPGKNVYILDFFDKDNLRLFEKLTKLYFSEGKIKSMQEIFDDINNLR